MRCPHCGSKVARHHRFCGDCGHRLAQQSAAAKPKKQLLDLFFPKQLRIAAAVLAGVFAVIALLMIIFFGGGKRQPVPRPTDLGDELTARPSRRGEADIATKAVYGKVTALQRGSMTIQSIPEGKAYTVYVGRRTRYDQSRQPALGEKVKVLYIEDRGYMKATQVQIQP